VAWSLLLLRALWLLPDWLAKWKRLVAGEDVGRLRDHQGPDR
jgi:hypothetical protein